MKYLSGIMFLILIGCTTGRAQSEFEIEAERFPLKFNKERIYKKAIDFINKEPKLILDSCSYEKGWIIASGQFKYINSVQSDFSENSKELGLLTNGIVSYKFKVLLSDSSYTTGFYHFTHSSVTPSTRYNLGILPSSQEYFLNKCLLDEAWCSLVYYDMVKTCQIETRVMWLKINW